MKLTTLVPTALLAVTAAGAEAETPIIDNSPFPWKNPFTHTSLKEYDTSCSNSIKLPATEFQLHDLYESPPLGLWPWADALKGFFGGQPYPRSWDGEDPHGYDRVVLKMEYEDVPAKAREWIKEKGEKLFAVYKKPAGEWKKIKEQEKKSKEEAPKTESVGEQIKEKVEEVVKEEEDLSDRIVIFAPGALYTVLPLFVAEGSKCADTLLDLEKYTPEPKDGAVIAGLKHTIADRKKQERDIEIEITAQVLKQKAAAAKDGKDEL